MKLTQFSLDNIKRLQAFTPVLVVGVLMLTGAVIYNFNARAATAGFYFTTPATSYKVGDTFAASIYENSGDKCANVVQADFTYPTDLLELVKPNSAAVANPTNSKFESTATSKDTNGLVSIAQYTIRKDCAGSMSGIAGEQFIATVTFKVKAAGTAALNFSGTSKAISSADNKTNVASSTEGLRITLAASTSPAQAATPTPAQTPTPKPVSVKPKPVTSITPSGSQTSLNVVDNEVVEIKKPVSIHPLPIQPDGINRIEYLLDGKPKATVKTAPYTYKLDTTKLLNGTYTLTTKTYYSNGQTKSVNQTIIVKNPFGGSQMVLQLKKFLWLIILLVLGILAAVASLLVHRRNAVSSNDTTLGYDPDAGSVVAPTVLATDSSDMESKANIEAEVEEDWKPLPTPEEKELITPTKKN